MDLDQWLEKVKGGNYLLEDELKQLCEYVSVGDTTWGLVLVDFGGVFRFREAVQCRGAPPSYEGICGVSMIHHVNASV